MNKKKQSIYKTCRHCKGTGKIKKRAPYLLTDDTKRMLALMKKHNLNQLSLAKVLEISQGAVNGWFHESTNLNGKIKNMYFKLLALKGYK